MDMNTALYLHHLDQNFNRDELEAVHQFEKALVVGRLNKAKTEEDRAKFNDKLFQLKAGYALLSEHLNNQEFELAAQEANDPHIPEESRGKVKIIGLAAASIAVCAISAMWVISIQSKTPNINTAQLTAPSETVSAQTVAALESESEKAERKADTAAKLAAHKAFVAARNAFKSSRKMWLDYDFKDKRLPIPIAKLQADIDLAVHAENKSRAIELIGTYVEQIDLHLTELDQTRAIINAASRQVEAWDQMRTEIGFANIDPSDDLNMLENANNALRAGKTVRIDEVTLESMTSKYELLNQKAAKVIELANQYANFKNELTTLNQDILDIATTPSTLSLVESAESAPQTREDLDQLVDKVYPRLLNFLSNKVETLQRTTS